MGYRLRHSVSRDREKLDKISLHNGSGKKVAFFSWDYGAQITVKGSGAEFSILFTKDGVGLKNESTGKWMFRNH